jgi:ribosomal protein S18 acetylase RimI-like enzyme
MAEWSIIPPSTSENWKSYYDLRYTILRKPWGLEPGSELAEDDDVSIHGMIINKTGEALAVGRIHITAPEQAQVRFMAVKENMQRMGLGKSMLHYLEKRAKREYPDLVQILLHARENAIEFYEEQDYQVIDKSYLLFGTIQHYLMVKSLI